MPRLAALAAPLGALLARIPAPARAGLYMIVATFLFAAVNGFIRHLAQQVPPVEVAFFRNFFGFLLLAPVLLAGSGREGLRTRRHGMYLARGAVSAAVTVAWAYALYLLPVDKATALNFTVPIWATIGAALVLKEHVGPRRWSAVAVGILGSLIILRPGMAAFEPGSVLPLVAAALMGASWLMVRSLARTEPPVRVVFYMGLYTAPFSLVPALFVWATPSPAFLFWALVMSAIGSVGHVIATRAYALAEASLLAPFDFFRLPFGALVGFLAFGELMDAPSWLGAGIILAACLYIAHREARLQRAAKRRERAG